MDSEDEWLLELVTSHNATRPGPTEPVATRSLGTPPAPPAELLGNSATGPTAIEPTGTGPTTTAMVPSMDSGDKRDDWQDLLLLGCSIPTEPADARIPLGDRPRMADRGQEAVRDAGPCCPLALRGDPPSIIAIRRERLKRERDERDASDAQQRVRWDMMLFRPQARRRRRSASLEQRCSSRSRSPGRCEEIAHAESSGLARIHWEHHCGLEPAMFKILCQARAAIQSHGSHLDFYVGVTRYLKRRWLGGDDLPEEKSHHCKWAHMYVLSTHRSNVGHVEDILIEALKRSCGAEQCTNVARGGGGVSPEKPALLYVCVGEL